MRTDERIKKDIIDRLSSDVRLDSSKIKVKVDNGETTLEGETFYYLDKLNASEITWAVNGVTSIKNKLTVKFPDTFVIPVDSEIKEQINTLLKWNAYVNEDDINVEVDSGIVTLEGTVPTFWEKAQAEVEAAYTSGVVSIVNKLAVVPTEKLSDEIIAENVMDRIEQTAPIAIDGIDVKVADRIVHLSGSVPSYNKWSDIYNTVQNTLGVSDVRDNLRIDYKS